MMNRAVILILCVYGWYSNTEQFVYLQTLLAPDGAAGDWLWQYFFERRRPCVGRGSSMGDDKGGYSGSLYVWHWNANIEQLAYVQKLLLPTALRVIGLARVCFFERRWPCVGSGSLFR